MAASVLWSNFGQYSRTFEKNQQEEEEDNEEEESDIDKTWVTSI